MYHNDNVKVILSNYIEGDIWSINMYNRKSEILVEFAKIAEDCGLIKIAEEKEDKKESKKDSEKSDSKSSFEMLYGENKLEVSPLIEQAHPETVVISPSYDKMNGIVENSIQQSAISNYIATRPPHSGNTHERYVKASQDLLDETIKIAFVLDKDDKLDLMQLADSCAGRLSGISKSAAPFVIPLIVKIPAIVAAVVALYTTFSENVVLNQSVAINTKKALTELQEAIESYSEDQSLSAELLPLRQSLELLLDISLKVSSVQSIVGKAAQEAANDKEMSAQFVASVSENNYASKIEKLFDSYERVSKYVANSLPYYINFLTQKDKELEVSEYNWWAIIKDIYRYAIPSDIKDAYLALIALQKALLDVPQEIRVKRELLSNAKQKMADPEEIKKILDSTEEPSPERPEELLPSPKKDNNVLVNSKPSPEELEAIQLENKSLL